MITITGDDPATVAQLKAINAATTGAITLNNATKEANLSGAAVDLAAALDGITGLTGNITITDLGAVQVNLSTITTTGTMLAIVPESAELHASTNLGNFIIMVDNDQMLTLSIAQANGKLIMPSSSGSKNGAVTLTGNATDTVYLDSVLTDITFASNAVSIAEGGTIIVNAASVTGDTLAISGVDVGLTQTFQVRGTENNDIINLGSFTTTHAHVVVSGLGGADTITLSNTAVEGVVYWSATEGGDSINNFNATQDLLQFKETDFGGSGVSLTAAGNKNMPVNGSSSSKADLGSLGSNFNGVIRIADNASSDWNDVVAIANGAITGSNDGIKVILMIDNDADTRVYFWNNGIGTDASAVEDSELTLIATLVGVNDATTVNSYLFGF